MPHLNELQEQFGAQGLSVIGVTGESDSAGRSQTVKWVEDKQAEYPYAYFERSSGFSDALGLRGYPHAVLVNPLGEIVWSGHPAMLTDRVVEDQLEGALATPLFELGKEVSGLRKALAKGDLGEALKEATELNEDGFEHGPALLDAVDGQIGKRVDALAAAAEQGDFLRVLEQAPELADVLDKQDERVARLEGLVDAIESDKESMRVVAGQKKVLKLLGGIDKLKKKKDAGALIDKLEALADDYPDTFVVEAVAKAVRQVRIAKADLR